MATKSDTFDRILKIQGETLGQLCKLPKKTFFEKSELITIAKADFGDVVVIQKVTVKVTPSIKSLAELILKKVI